MKTFKLKYSLLLAGTLSLFACQKNEIEVASPNLATVSNINYTLQGDSVLVTWSLPQSADPLKVMVNNGTASKELAANTTSYKFGVVETNKEYAFTVKVTDKNGNISLGELVRFKRDGAAPVKSASAEQNDAGVLVKWSAPELAVSKIQIKLGNQTVEAAANATSYQFSNVPVGSYNISVITTNSANQTSNTVYIPFKVGATAVAYLSTYSDSTALLTAGDDDEIAAAKWLFKTYAKSRYISFDQIKNGTVDLSQFRVIWWNYDVQTGNALPAISKDAAVLAKMTTYYKNGGNFLFDKYALQYLSNLGRLADPYFMEFGNGDGFDNPDTWGIGVKIGKKHDMSGHPLYKGIAMKTEGDGRITFPIISGGWKENHNAVIIRIPEYLKLEPNDNEASYEAFATINNLEWLGQWDGIGDYWMAGVIEFKPKADFQGSSIFLGIGAIEWSQKSGTNLYQSNVEKMYKNAIDYLKTK